MKPKVFWILLVCFVALTFAGHALAQVTPAKDVATAAAENSGAAASAALIIAQFLSSVKVGGFATWAIEAMKRSKLTLFNWINPQSKGMILALSWLAAAATASGIDYAWNGMEHSLIITGLSAPAIGHALWHTASNYLVQKGWYRTVFQPDAAKSAPGQEA